LNYLFHTQLVALAVTETRLSTVHTILCELERLPKFGRFCSLSLLPCFLPVLVEGKQQRTPHVKSSEGERRGWGEGHGVGGEPTLNSANKGVVAVEVHGLGILGERIYRQQRAGQYDRSGGKVRTTE
jgi:hypothetical protein